MSKVQRQEWSRKGGLTTLSRHGGVAMTAPARAAFLAQFEQDADPDKAKSAYFRSLIQRRWAAKRTEAAQADERTATSEATPIEA